MRLNNKRKKMKKKWLIILLMALITISFYLYFENNLIDVTAITVEDSEIPRDFDGYTIVQISDLHNAEFGSNNEKLVQKVREEKPDVIFITGDLVDSRRTDLDVALDFIGRIADIGQIYYVTGNHEARIDEVKNLMNGLEENGVIILRNETVMLRNKQSEINLVGVQDPLFTPGNGNHSTEIMRNNLNGIIYDDDNYTILLAHRPEKIDLYTEWGADLVFSGHAHGGQIRLPVVGGLFAPAQGFLPKYTAGLHEEGETKMIVSRGLGNSLFPFRVNNNPEIVVVELKVRSSN